MIGSITTRLKGAHAENAGESPQNHSPDGLSVQCLYNSVVRPFLPYKLSVHNGVVAKQAKLFDRTETFPDYEDAILSALRARVHRGDDVVVVGGGIGASSVTAAEEAGSTGSVVTYEAGEVQVEIVSETLALNGLRERVNLCHGIVGSAISLYSEAGDAEVVDPTELPDCDILELDCEGAEVEILDALKIRPRTIIVETHGKFDAPEHLIRQKLDELGYEVVERTEDIPEEGVFVLTAVRND
jgi:hypothetical protein